MLVRAKKEKDERRRPLPYTRGLGSGKNRINHNNNISWKNAYDSSGDAFVHPMLSGFLSGAALLICSPRTPSLEPLRPHIIENLCHAR